MKKSEPGITLILIAPKPITFEPFVQQKNRAQLGILDVSAFLNCLCVDFALFVIQMHTTFKPIVSQKKASTVLALKLSLTKQKIHQYNLEVMPLKRHKKIQ